MALPTGAGREVRLARRPNAEEKTKAKYQWGNEKKVDFATLQMVLTV
jgi:hypothetical protein